MEIDEVVGVGELQSSPARPQSSADFAGQETAPESRKGKESALEYESNLSEDDEDVCRICRIPGNEEAPLYYPCACSGSIKYVHQDCLLQWLNHSNARDCEVCKHAFSFSPVYAENAPSRLPIEELLLGMVLKAVRGMRFFVRLMFVLCIWLLFIPFATFWIWRFTFVRSFGEARNLFIGRFTPGLLLTDCVHGFFLSAGIVFIFLGATSFREYFRHLREVGGPEGGRAEEGEDGLRAGRQAFQEVDGAVGQVADWHHPPPVGVNADVDLGQGRAAGAGQLILRDAENVAARLELQAARLEAHVEQMFDPVEDPDGAEDVPFDELVGMQGPVFHLVENAITVLASNAIFLGLVALIPFTIGRIVLSLASSLLELYLNASGVLPTVSTSLSIGSTASPGNLSSDLFGNNMYLGNDMNTAAGTVDVGLNGRYVSISQPEATMASLRLSDAATVALGYSVILSALSSYAGLIALIRYSRGDPIRVGHIHGVSRMAEAAPSVAMQMMARLKHMATMVKVVFLLIIELGVFPFVCGWWLDICTLAMLDASIAQRVEFFQASPLRSLLLHWLVGITYMLQISILVSLLREVLRPSVLFFLRDPTDPNYNPFRDLIDDPLHKHVGRVVLSVIFYGSLIVMLVFLPVRLAIFAVPSIFPLDLRVSDPFTQSPADMVLLYIGIPIAMDHFRHFRPRATIKAALFHWFSSVGWALGLHSFLLLAPDEVDDNNNVQGRRPRRQELAEGQPRHPNHSEQSGNIAEDFDDEERTEEWKFVLRIVMLLVAAWITLLVFNSAMILVPVSVGRGICGLFSRLPIARDATCYDLYAFNLGCYVLWATADAVRHLVVYLRAYDMHVVLRQVSKWSAIVAKSFVLLFLWIIVIPIGVGLLFELAVVVPFRVPIDETPVFFLYQDWALGLVFLTLWTRVVMLGQVTPLADERWQARFQQVRNDGFANLQGFWVLKEIIAPFLIRLLTALCVPYIFGGFLFPYLGYSLMANSAVNRFSWLGCAACIALWYGMKRLRQWLLDLHNSIRDDRYLVGRRLHNFGERKRNDIKTPKAENSPPDSRSGAIPVEEVSRIGGPIVERFNESSVIVSSSGTSGGDLLEGSRNVHKMESTDVLLRAAQEDDRIGLAGTSLRFRHPGTTVSEST